MVEQDGGTTQLTTVSGGGVTTWTKLVSGGGGSGVGAWIDIWWGVVTTTGAASITITGYHSGNNRLYAQEFSGGSGTWSADPSTASFGATAQVTSFNYPSLTPVGSGELWLGGAGTGFGFTAGSTSGFVYSTAQDVYATFVYSVSAPCPSAPNQNQSNYYYGAACGLLVFTPPTISFPITASWFFGGANYQDFFWKRGALDATSIPTESAVANQASSCTMSLGAITVIPAVGNVAGSCVETLNSKSSCL